MVLLTIIGIIEDFKRESQSTIVKGSSRLQPGKGICIEKDCREGVKAFRYEAVYNREYSFTRQWFSSIHLNLSTPWQALAARDGAPSITTQVRNLQYEKEYSGFSGGFSAAARFFRQLCPKSFIGRDPDGYSPRRDRGND